MWRNICPFNFFLICCVYYPIWIILLAQAFKTIIMLINLKKCTCQRGRVFHVFSFNDHCDAIKRQWLFLNTKKLLWITNLLFCFMLLTWITKVSSPKDENYSIIYSPSNHPGSFFQPNPIRVIFKKNLAPPSFIMGVNGTLRFWSSKSTSIQHKSNPQGYSRPSEAMRCVFVGKISIFTTL